MESDRESLLLLLIQGGNISDAAKVYQEETGVSYFEAKRRVNRIARRHGMRQSRVLPWTLLLIAAVTAVGLLWHH